MEERNRIAGDHGAPDGVFHLIPRNAMTFLLAKVQIFLNEIERQHK